jgi:hypothetical protein
MGRHSGFFVGLCVVSTLLAGRFAGALNEMGPPTAANQMAVTLGESGTRLPGIARTKTLVLPPNSLIVLTSLDPRGGPHTFEILARSAGVFHDGASQPKLSSQMWPREGARRPKMLRAGETNHPEYFESEVTNETVRRTSLQAASQEAVIVPPLQEPAIERRFLAPRYGTTGVTDSMVLARLIAADHRVAVYVDPTLAAVHFQSLLDSRNAISPGLISDLIHAVSEHLGTIHDLDHDGRLAILITNLDCQEDSQSVPVLGCVRPSDFLGPSSDADERTELTDVVYLDACLPKGNDLTALLAHELAHAAVYCRLHDRQINHRVPLELPDWLHEGIAHHVEFTLAEKTLVYQDRLEQFHRVPYRSPICASPVSSSRSERRGGSRAAISRFLQFAVRGDEDWSRWLIEADNANELLVCCLEDRFDVLLAEWSLQEAVEMSRNSLLAIPELRLEQRTSHEILGTAFKVLKSGSHPIELEIHCLDDSPWEVRWTALPSDSRLTQHPTSMATR